MAFGRAQGREECKAFVAMELARYELELTLPQWQGSIDRLIASLKHWAKGEKQ